MSPVFRPADNSAIDVNGVLCKKANRPLGEICQTVWFNIQSRRFTEKGADFAHGKFKGQCGEGQYLKGVAHSGGRVQALRCCGTEVKDRRCSKATRQASAWKSKAAWRRAAPACGSPPVTDRHNNCGLTMKRRAASAARRTRITAWTTMASIATADAWICKPARAASICNRPSTWTGWYMRHRNSPVHTIDLGDSGRIGNLALPWPRQPEMARSLLITHAEPQASRMC